MAQDNTVTIVGNLTRDIELRYTGAGTAQARIGVAVNHRKKNRETDEWEDDPKFFNVVAWGDLAEHAEETLEKGNRVVIVGRLEQRTWETDEGEKRNVVEIIADEIAPSLRWATAEVTRVGKTRESVGGTKPDVDLTEEPF